MSGASKGPADQRPARSGGEPPSMPRKRGELETLDARRRTCRRRSRPFPLSSAFAAPAAVHPIMQTMDEMIAVFAEMGFALAEGPDIEDDFHNFTALNFPPKHPAREMHDTFFFRPGPDGERKLLRTHTSPVQVRTMRQGNISRRRRRGSRPGRRRRSGSFPPAAPIAATATRRTPRCSTSSRGW